MKGTLPVQISLPTQCASPVYNARVLCTVACPASLHCFYTASAQCTIGSTERVHCKCTVNMQVHWQCTLLVHSASISALAVYALCAQYICKSTYSLHCKFTVHRYVCFKCTLHIHSVPVSALPVYTVRALYCMQAQCVRAVRRTPPLKTGWFELRSWRTLCARKVHCPCSIYDSSAVWCAEVAETRKFREQHCTAGTKKCVRFTLLCRKSAD